MSRVVITGGHGFLGHKLAERLLAEPGAAAPTELTLADQAPPPAGGPAADPRVSSLTGDVADPRFLAEIITEATDVVYHLASVVSAGAEQDFDLGYAVNLAGTIALLERCRAVNAARQRPVTVVFTSSLATYGSGADQPVTDRTALRPETSYGVQKASCELLLNDYHRKGFIDGRGLRLPTVSVRPGKPNLAASGFASGIIREPLAGVDTICPVTEDTVMSVISPRRVIDALCRIVDIEDDAIGVDRTVLLPGLSMSMGEAVAATAETAGGRPLGTVRFDQDEEVQRIIDSWPPVIAAERAIGLGLVGDGSVAAIVRQHIEDELEA